MNLKLRLLHKLNVAFVAFALLFNASQVAAQNPTATAKQVTPPPATTPATKQIDEQCPVVPQTSETVIPVVRVRAAEQAVDAQVAEDAAINNLLAPYKSRVAELSKTIGTLDTDIERRGIGAGTIGNFVSDAMRAQALKTNKNVRLAITNFGGLRKSQLPKGDLRAADIYELLPFENALVTVDLTGAQLARLFQTLVAERDVQSGAIVKYRTDAPDRPQFSSLELLKPGGTSNARKARTERLNPNQIYTVVTTDYMVNRGGRYATLKEGTNVKPLNVTLRDAVIDYIKNETAARRRINPQLDGRFARADGGTPDTGEGR